MEIKLKVPRPELEGQNIIINLPERKNEGKNPANLSDADLANKTPDELEEIRRAKENLREIKKTDLEVKAMVSQEQLEARINEYMEAKGLSREDAEVLAKRDFGQLTRAEIGPLHMQPPSDPVADLLKKALADKLSKMLFPEEGAGATGATGVGGPGQAGGQAAPPISEAIKAAREHGVNAIYLPDGTYLQLKPTDTLGDELIKETGDWLKKQVPTLFAGAGDKLSGDLVGSQNPDIVRLGLEYRAKEEERKTAEIISQSKTDMAKEFAAAIGLLFSPEGFEKAKQALTNIRRAATGPEGGGPPNLGPRMHDLPCDECKAVNQVPEGQNFVCTQCGTENEVTWK